MVGLGVGGESLRSRSACCLLVVATSSDDTLVLDLEPGECFDLADDDGSDAIGTVETGALRRTARGGGGGGR